MKRRLSRNFSKGREHEEEGEVEKLFSLKVEKLYSHEYQTQTHDLLFCCCCLYFLFILLFILFEKRGREVAT